MAVEVEGGDHRSGLGHNALVLITVLLVELELVQGIAAFVALAFEVNRLVH